MKKFFVLCIFFLSRIAYAQNSIEGVWSIFPDAMKAERLFERDFSWGKRTLPRIVDIIVDLHSKLPSIEIVEFSWDKIICVNEKGSVTELTFYFARGGFYVTMICHFNENGTMWIEPLSNGLTFFRTGRDQIYYKVDGP